MQNFKMQATQSRFEATQCLHSNHNWIILGLGCLCTSCKSFDLFNDLVHWALPFQSHWAFVWDEMSVVKKQISRILIEQKSSNSNPKREATGKRVRLCFCSQHVYQHTSTWDCTAKIIQAILTSACIEIPSNLAGNHTSTQHHHDHQQKFRFRKIHQWQVRLCRTSHHQVLGQKTPWKAQGFVFQKC